MDFEKVRRYKRCKYSDLSPDVLHTKSELLPFLYSGAIFRLDQEERRSLLKNLRTKYLDNNFKCLFDFLDFSFSKADEYWNVAMVNSKGVCAEDILSLFEFYGSRMLVKNISIDGKKYDDDIINSQHDFLLGVLPTLLKFVQVNEVPFSGRQSCNKKQQSTKIIESLSQYHSINTKINEVIKGGYLAKPISFLYEKYDLSNDYKELLESNCQFFMQRTTEDLDSQETYRDLNYRLEYKEEKNLDAQYKIMEEAGLAKHHKDIDLLHFDFAQGEKYEIDMQFHKVSSFLEQIYFSCETALVYNEQKYTIKDLVDISKSIYMFANRLQDRNLKNLNSKKSSFITISGKKSLFRALMLDKKMESLIDLFTASSNQEISNSPILKFNNLYYIFPQHAVDFCFEKIVDKVLSSKNVLLHLPKGIQKGHLFESRIIKLFSSAGYNSYSVKGNPGKGVPEIDAIIELDDHNMFVIEAKCTIKPESRFEAYSFIENHMKKAIDQLAFRVDFLTKHSTSKVNYTLPFKTEERNFIPLIVTNHSYFTGMKVLISEGVEGYCIDEFLLKKIVKNRIIPKWTYLQTDNSYGVEDIKLNGIQGIINAIKNPVAYLDGKTNRTIQILEYGVAFEISKHAVINWEYKYNKEMQRMA